MQFVIFLGRNQKIFEEVAQKAPKDKIFIFMRDDDEKKSLERAKKKAEFWAEKLKMPVIAEEQYVKGGQKYA